jgi:phosphatidylglycerophosphate synthase
MILSFTLDLFDGALARVQGPTTFGGILDIFCDRAVEVSILLSLAASDFTMLGWPSLLSISAIVLCITIFLLVGGAVKIEELAETQKVLYYQKGLMERSETFFFLLAMVLLPWVRVWLLWIFAILVFITALQRLWIASTLFTIPIESGNS